MCLRVAARACGSSTATPLRGRCAPKPSSEAKRRAAGVIGVSPYAEREDKELTFLSVVQLKGTWIAAQGSRAAPTLPESRARSSRQDFRSVPLRPMNSVGRRLRLRASSRRKKRPSANPCCRGSRAKSAPLPGQLRSPRASSISAAGLPSTHSTYPVADSRRDRPDSFRTFNTENLMGASGPVRPTARSGCRAPCARRRCSRIRAG